MLLLLTNATPEHQGNPIVINRDHILSVYRVDSVDDEGTVNQYTNIFCPPHGTWTVQETPEEIVEIANKK